MGRIRRAVGRLASRFEALVLPRDELVPPLHLRWKYYRTAGRDSYRRFAEAASKELLSRGLLPHHRVLDVGFGLGPLAVGLLPHLAGGSYAGFDVHAEAVAWCRRAITPRHPRFRFQHADLFNTAYNPRGTLRASTYRFPFDAAEFDFAFLGSVCTHLLPAEVAHYLDELARVLKPGGRSVVSFYLLSEESLRGIEAGTSFLPFCHLHEEGRSRVVDRNNPEAAIAHGENWVRNWYAEAGLRIEEPIRRGRWWDGVPHQQDVVAAMKPV